jgi:hypothetical protein
MSNSLPGRDSSGDFPMKHTFLPFALLSALACSSPESSGDRESVQTDSVEAAALPLVRYYVIGDT